MGNGTGRCRLHGGKSDVNRYAGNGNFKHGLYSKYAGESLQEVLNELEDVDSEELLQPEQEIKLMQALIMRSQSLANGLSDLEDLNTISRILERLVSAKQRSQKIMLEQQRLIPAEDLKAFLGFMQGLLTRRFNVEQSNEIMGQLKSFKISETG